MWSTAAVLGVLALPTVAVAQPPANPSQAVLAARDRAMQRYDEGTVAFDQRRFKDAIDLFLEADRIAPHPSYAFNAALASERMGDNAGALQWSREYLRRQPDAPDRAEVEATIERMQRALRERGVQQLTVRSSPDGATVFVDGTAVGVTPWTGQLAPGLHQVGLHLRGHADQESAVVLPDERAEDLAFTLVPAPAVAPPPPPAPTVEPPAPTIDLAYVIWPTLGLATLCFVATTGVELERASLAEQARLAHTRGEADLLDAEASDHRLATGVLVGAGVALSAAGGALLALHLLVGDAPREDTGTLACGLGHCRFGARF